MNFSRCAILDDMAKQVYAANEEKGFWETPIWALVPGTDRPETTYTLLKKAEKIALMHSELSECLEGIRKPGPDGHCPDFTSEEVELADVLIRLLDYAAGFKLRLAEATHAKLAYNASRPFKHGKRF